MARLFTAELYFWVDSEEEHLSLFFLCLHRAWIQIIQRLMYKNRVLDTEVANLGPKRH